MSRKTGMNKVEIALLKKHIAGETSERDILKVFKHIKAPVVKGFIGALTKKEEKPAAKKAAAKKPAAKKEDDDII